MYFDGDAATNLDALLARDDIHAVAIALPITVQPSIIRKCLAAGKHVLSEKPVAPDVAGGIALIEEYNKTYKPKGLVWRVAENWEVEPGYHVAAKAIRDGKIGKVNSFNARVVNYVAKDSKWYKTPWRTVPDVSAPFVLANAAWSSMLTPSDSTRADSSYVTPRLHRLLPGTDPHVLARQLDGGVVSRPSAVRPVASC